MMTVLPLLFIEKGVVENLLLSFFSKSANKSAQFNKNHGNICKND